MSKNKFIVDLFVKKQQLVEAQEQEEFSIVTQAELTETDDSYFLIFEQTELFEEKQVKSNNRTEIEAAKFSLKIQKDLDRIILRRFGASSYVLEFINFDLSYNYINTNYGRLELRYRTNRIVKIKDTEKNFEINLDYDLMQGDSVLANNKLSIAFSKVAS